MNDMPNKPAGQTEDSTANSARAGLLLSASATRRQHALRLAGETGLLLVTCASVFAVLFIFYFITRDAVPFFRLRGLREFFTSTKWYPSGEPAEFGVLSIFYGSAMVTVGSSMVAVPLGVTAAICLSDVLPFRVRQFVKPVIEMLAAIPSVAYGFFALVVFAPLLQNRGGHLLSVGLWCIGVPFALIVSLIVSDMFTGRFSGLVRQVARAVLFVVASAGAYWLLSRGADALGAVQITSGTNALNVSIILGIMALPTVVSVSEDSLQAVSREIREGSYALGATRAETLINVVVPAASSGICAAIILGIMRALGETMVVWMASGNSAKIPTPWYNFLDSVRTLTATIAGDMGEADHVTGSARYHVLFAMAFCLLVFSFVLNLISEWAVKRTARKTGRA
jgi:phosphate transport system permease protein